MLQLCHDVEGGAWRLQKFGKDCSNSRILVVFSVRVRLHFMVIWFDQKLRVRFRTAAVIVNERKKDAIPQWDTLRSQYNCECKPFPTKKAINQDPWGVFPPIREASSSPSSSRIIRLLVRSVFHSRPGYRVLSPSVGSNLSTLAFESKYAYVHKALGKHTSGWGVFTHTCHGQQRQVEDSWMEEHLNSDTCSDEVWYWPWVAEWRSALLMGLLLIPRQHMVS